MGSEQYGWLVPEPGPESKKIEDIFGAMVCALCGLSGKDVVPRWQEQPPKNHEHGENWCAFGIVGESAPGPAVWHQNGYSRLMVDQQMELLFSFYGPGAREKAKALRDGLWVEQNRAILRLENNISLLQMGQMLNVPEIYGNRWLSRWDISISFIMGPEVWPKGKAEGDLDIKDLTEAKPCGLCHRSR